MRLSRRAFLSALGVAAVAPALPELPVAAPAPLRFKGAICAFDNNFPIGTVGGINRATFSFWRNQQQPSGAAFEQLRDELRRVYNECARGGGSGIRLDELGLSDGSRWERVIG